MNRSKGLGKIFQKNNSFTTNSQAETQPQDYEGQLAIDCFQTDDAVVVEAPIAGVKAGDISISVTDDVLSIEGERKRDYRVNSENFLVQECYWGKFSRSYIIPIPIDPDRAQAKIKDGMLRVILPKQDTAKTKVIKVEGAA